MNQGVSAHIMGKSGKLPVRVKAELNRDNRPFYRYGGHIEVIRFKEDAQGA